MVAKIGDGFGVAEAAFSERPQLVSNASVALTARRERKGVMDMAQVSRASCRQVKARVTHF
jgi:hypothetical protein